MCLLNYLSNHVQNGAMAVLCWQFVWQSMMKVCLLFHCACTACKIKMNVRLADIRIIVFMVCVCVLCVPRNSKTTSTLCAHQYSISAGQPHCISYYYYYYYYLLKSYSPINRTGLPQGFSKVQTLQKSNTNHSIKQNQSKQNIAYTTATNIKHISKNSIFDIVLVYNST